MFFPVNPSVNTAGFSTTDSQFCEQTVCTCVSVAQVVLSLKISKFISNAEITLLRRGSIFYHKWVKKKKKSRLMCGHVIIVRL